MRLNKEKRKEMLLNVATELFIEKGYHNTTTKDIANAAGITEPVIYRHFASKYELFFEVIYKIVSEAIGNIKIQQDAEFEVFLERFIYMHLENVNKHFRSLKFLFSQILQDDELKNYYSEEFAPKMVRLISPYIMKLNSQRLNDYSPQFNLFILGGMVMIFELAEGLYDFIPEELSREDMSKRLAKIYLRSITERQV